MISHAMSKATLLGVVMVFAGCVSGDAKGTDGRATTSATPSGTQFGSIRGLVIDDTLLPVPGANVALHGTSQSTFTGLDGLFEIVGAPVGDHTLVVNATGFNPVSKQVFVTERETTFTEITVERVASDIGYYHTRILRGVLMCSATYRQSVITVGLSSFTGYTCANQVTNGSDVDESTMFFHLGDNVSAWRGGAVETVWQSTQFFGNGLVQDWAVYGCANNRNATFGRDFGPSPLRNVLGSFELEYRLQDIPNASCGADEDCNPRGCHMIIRIFSWPSTQPPEAPADVGVTLEQTFSSYFTEFFRMEPPPAFTALADA